MSRQTNLFLSRSRQRHPESLAAGLGSAFSVWETLQPFEKDDEMDKHLQPFQTERKEDDNDNDDIRHDF